MRFLVTALSIVVLTSLIYPATAEVPSRRAALTIWYVDDDGDPVNGCTSWDDACPELQTALVLANSGDQIWVAEGTYTPTLETQPGDPRSATFQLISGVAIYGGFDGTETALEDRVALFEQTILSGDLNADDDFVTCTVDDDCLTINGRLCSDELCIIPDSNGENSYHVTTGSATDNTAILDGFSITGGNADELCCVDDAQGGGMFNDSSNPTVTNCTFSGNFSRVSGGMYNTNSSPTVTNCTFSGNFANSGGGMTNRNNSSPTVTNCTFSGNAAGVGGAMVNHDSSIMVTNCTFSGNSADSGGAMYNSNSSPTISGSVISGNSAGYGKGGGIACFNSSATIYNCVIMANTASDGSGGGISCRFGSPTISKCAITGNTASNQGGGIFCGVTPNAVITDCIIKYNHAGGAAGSSGGGIASRGNDNFTIRNCLIADNTTANDGAGILCDRSSLTVRNSTITHNEGNGIFSLGGAFEALSCGIEIENSILWGNSAAGGSEFYIAAASTAVIRYSDILQEGGAVDVSGDSTLNWGHGNIDADPLFVDPDGPDDDPATWEDNDYHLSPGSPCIDAADNTAVPVDTGDLDSDGDTDEPIPFDLDGNPRFVDDPDTPDTGNPDGINPIVDMGAYEFQGVEVVLDLDIKPGSCPNPFNRKNQGILPVALVGTEEFDPAEVDLSTLQLSRADGVGGSVVPNEGPPGPHSVLEDVATSFDGEGCACHDLGGDGIDDLSMKFKTRDLMDALELDDLSGGVVVELVLSGSLLDGTPFVASDCIIIVPPGDLAPTNAFVGSNVSDTFVAVTPIDLNFDGDGFADFARSYYSGTALTLTAPARSEGRRFVRWSVDGVLQEVGVRTLELVVDQDINLRAFYERGRRLRPDRPTEDGGSVE